MGGERHFYNYKIYSHILFKWQCHNGCIKFKRGIPSLCYYYYYFSPQNYRAQNVARTSSNGLPSMHTRHRTTTLNRRLSIATLPRSSIYNIWGVGAIIYNNIILCTISFYFFIIFLGKHYRWRLCKPAMTDDPTWGFGRLTPVYDEFSRVYTYIPTHRVAIRQPSNCTRTEIILRILSYV